MPRGPLRGSLGSASRVSGLRRDALREEVDDVGELLRFGNERRGYVEVVGAPEHFGGSRCDGRWHVKLFEILTYLLHFVPAAARTDGVGTDPGLENPFHAVGGEGAADFGPDF